MSVGLGLIPQARLTCPSCRRQFEKQEGLPLKESSPVPAAAPDAGVEASKPARWSGPIAIVFGGLALTLWLGTGKNGPDFLWFYFIVWLITFFGSIVTRLFSWGKRSGLVAFCIFEGLGISRIITGALRGCTSSSS
jgi:hypothetical protein